MGACLLYLVSWTFDYFTSLLYVRQEKSLHSYSNCCIGNGSSTLSQKRILNSICSCIQSIINAFQKSYDQQLPLLDIIRSFEFNWALYVPIRTYILFYLHCWTLWSMGSFLIHELQMSQNPWRFQKKSKREEW